LGVASVGAFPDGGGVLKVSMETLNSRTLSFLVLGVKNIHYVFCK